MNQPAHAFPWREEERFIGTGEPILRPTLIVRLSAGTYTTQWKALIDSGSPRTIFPRGTGDFLSVKFPDNPRDADKRISLFGQQWSAVSATVQLELPPFEDLGWEAEVDFLLDDGIPFGLLGYEGFLNRWAVSMNGYHGYFVVDAVDHYHERQDPALLDRLNREWPGLVDP